MLLWKWQPAKCDGGTFQTPKRKRNTAIGENGPLLGLGLSEENIQRLKEKESLFVYTEMNSVAKKNLGSAMIL